MEHVGLGERGGHCFSICNPTAAVQRCYRAGIPDSVGNTRNILTHNEINVLGDDVKNGRKDGALVN